jgi:hypothetical protein
VFTVTGKVDVEVLPQTLLAVTVIFPLTVPVITVILSVFCPAVITQSEGTTHKYPVALITVGVE